MRNNWLKRVTPYSESAHLNTREVREKVRRRQLFGIEVSGRREYIIPDFQMRGNKPSPWVAPLLGALVWIEDKTVDRDRNGLARGRWLFRRRGHLSEIALAGIGYWPPDWDPNEKGVQHWLDVLALGLDDGPRSFAEIFKHYPRLVIDYQYRLQGIRWDTVEYQI